MVVMLEGEAVSGEALGNSRSLVGDQTFLSVRLPVPPSQACWLPKFNLETQHEVKHDLSPALSTRSQTSRPKLKDPRDTPSSQSAKHRHCRGIESNIHSMRQ
jgi:hypothetical protein